MKGLRSFVLLALLPSLAWTSPALAQVSRPAALSLAQAERSAVNLRQGMSAEEVQQLLGKPRRTALKSTGGSSEPWQGTLHWSYAWTGASSADSNLQVVFAARKPGEWYVHAWEWSRYAQ